MMMPSAKDIPFGPKREHYADIENMQFSADSSSKSCGKVTTATTLRKPLHQEVKTDTTWVVPTSTKAIRAVNPVTFAFNRLADKVKLGSQRSDGKDPISLAVSFLVEFCHQKSPIHELTPYFALYFGTFL